MTDKKKYLQEIQNVPISEDELSEQRVLVTHSAVKANKEIGNYDHDKVDKALLLELKEDTDSHEDLEGKTIKIYIATDWSKTKLFSNKPQYVNCYDDKEWHGDRIYGLEFLIPKDFNQKVGECVEGEITITINPLIESKPSKGLTTTKV